MFEKQAYLGDLIRQRVPLGRLSATGFEEQKCLLCHDHSARAGWKITPEQVFYNCYNCGFHASYEEGTGAFSRWMKELCAANGISEADLQEISATLFFNRAEKTTKEITLESLRKVNLVTPEVKFPARTLQLGSAGHDELQEPIIKYLLDRKVDPLKFYFSTSPELLRRVIIPFWRDDKLIFWQARTIDKDVKPRYKNCALSKDAVIYGFDKLYTYSQEPLFVTEGVFDAESIGGICILGSKLNAAKIELLKRTKRRIIFVVDRDSNGGHLGEAVIDNGWELTFVDPNAEDVNDSVVKFGKIYTVYTLIKNATNKFDPARDQLVELGLELAFSNMRKSKYGN
jgi:hypothetical protein